MGNLFCRPPSPSPPGVNTALPDQWALYAAGAPEQPEVGCYLDHLAPRLNEAGGLAELIVELAASDYLTKGVDR
jgi:hypothetical protein